jgi:hypothetical protein
LHVYATRAQPLNKFGRVEIVALLSAIEAHNHFAYMGNRNTSTQLAMQKGGGSGMEDLFGDSMKVRVEHALVRINPRLEDALINLSKSTATLVDSFSAMETNLSDRIEGAVARLADSTSRLFDSIVKNEKAIKAFTACVGVSIVLWSSSSLLQSYASFATKRDKKD